MFSCPVHYCSIKRGRGGRGKRERERESIQGFRHFRITIRMF
ncbi:unnamed protein product [Spirodela intermedia]|uniref:Uncharacterized protein n=1 Tax=Spirodela intermedia TaxID=51605 RepID=A0A7I8LGE9_SPIIN|nr:unnamed protein product [Spirodela intermedia]